MSEDLVVAHCAPTLAGLKTGSLFVCPKESLPIFLGYPPADVEGFLTYGGSRARASGTWQAYGDVEAAERKFRQYRRCTGAYKRAYARHGSLDRLVVGNPKRNEDAV